MLSHVILNAVKDLASAKDVTFGHGPDPSTPLRFAQGDKVNTARQFVRVDESTLEFRYVRK